MFKLKEELKHAFRSPYFWFSFVFMFLCFQGYPIPGLISEFENGIELEFRESALQQSIGGVFFGGVMMFMPFCAAAAHAVSQVDELNSGMMRWRVLRKSVYGYAGIKMAASAIAAACAAAGAFILHSMIWNIIAVPVDPMLYPAHEIGFADECVFEQWYKIAKGFPVYAEIACGIAVTAAIWAIVALAVAVWVPDRLLVVSIPACIYYLWHLRLPYYLFGIKVPHPGDLYNDGLNLMTAVNCLEAYAVVLGISILLYFMGLRRKTRYA